MCPFCIASAVAAIAATAGTSAAAGGATALIVRRLRVPMVGADTPVRGPVRGANHGTTQNCHET